MIAYNHPVERYRKQLGPTIQPLSNIDMEKSQKLRSGWENRFPDLGEKWTHWKIMGDGGFLAFIEGKDLIGAMRVIDDNYGRFDSIKVCRAIVDQNGQSIEEEKALFEISRFKYDERIR